MRVEDRSNMDEAQPAQVESQPAQVSKVRIYGRMGSAVGYMIRDFLHRSDVPFEWIEVNTDEDARRLAGVSSLNDSRLPVCVFADGTRMECPTVRQITEKLGWLHDPCRSE